MELANILPQVVLLTTAVLILLQNIFIGDSRHNLIFGGLGTALALICSVWLIQGADYYGIHTDYLARISLFILLLAQGLIFVFSLNREELIGSYTEWTFLFITATIGLSVVAGSLNLILIFIASQVAFFSLLFLTTFKNDRKGIDASWKYLFSALVFSLFYLLGVTLVFIAGGGVELDKFSSVASDGSLLFWSGFFLILLSLFYKLALFPFHNWAADVYENTSAPLAAYLATATKLPVFILLIRLLNAVSSPRLAGIQLILWFFAATTVIFINILALRENNLRGMLAYSSITQCGYPLLGLLVGGPDAHIAIIYFLIVFILMTINVYGIIMFATESRDGSCYYPDLAGFSEKHKLLAICLGVGLVALTGLPPTAGLFGRIFLYREAFRGGYLGLVLIATVGTLLSAAYYFKVIRYAFFEPYPEGFSTPNKLTPLAGVAAFLTTGFILLNGIFPAVLYRPLRILINFL